MKKLDHNEQRAKIAITSILVVLVFDIVLLILNFYRYNLLQAVTNGVTITTEITTEIVETAETIDSRIGTATIIELIAYIISIIFFIRWFSRAYSNLHRKVTGLLYSKGWAIGCWFVPILNFYRPYRIMKELCRKTETLLSIEKPNLSETIDVWWFLFIVSAFVDRALSRFETETTIKQLMLYTTIYFFSSIINILYALITISIIKDYSKMESLLFQADENYLDEQKEEPQENELQENPIDIEKVNLEEYNQTAEKGKYDKFIFLIPIMVVIISILIGTIINFFKQ